VFTLTRRIENRNKKGAREERRRQSKAPPFPEAESEGWATRKIESKIERSLRVGHAPRQLPASEFGSGLTPPLLFALSSRLLAPLTSCLFPSDLATCYIQRRMGSRLRYLKQSFRQWQRTILVIWAVISAADTLIGHYGTPRGKEVWDRLWLLPQLGWRNWLLGFLLLTLIFLFENSFRTARDLRKDLEKALERHSGPEFTLDFDLRKGGLVVTNVGKGTAHNIVIHKFVNRRLFCLEHRIGYVPEGQSAAYNPYVESVSGMKYTIESRFEAFLCAAHRTNPPELDDATDAVIPVRVTYWDGITREFVDEFQMRYNVRSRKLDTMRTSHVVSLRKGG
jgi:hypothetical protein